MRELSRMSFETWWVEYFILRGLDRRLCYSRQFHSMCVGRHWKNCQKDEVSCYLYTLSIMIGTGGHVWMTFQTFGFGSPFKIWRFYHPFCKSTDPALKFDWLPCRLVWKAQSSETSYFAVQNFGWRQHNSNTTQHGCIELHRTVKTKNPLCLHLKKNPKLSVETGGTLPCPNLTFKAWEN